MKAQIKSINRNLLSLILGRMVSDIGSSIHMLIMPLFIIDSGASPGVVGIFAFLALIPTLLVYPIAGAIGDRLNRKKIMVLADLISAGILFFLFYTAQVGQLNMVILLAAQGCIALSYGFFDPATKGMIPNLVSKEKLSETNSLVASMRILSGLVAPLIAVYLYTELGVATLFFINGASFLFSAVMEITIKYTHKAKSGKINISLVTKDLVDGGKFLKEHKSILVLSLYFLAIYTFIQPIFSVILPLFYRTQLSFGDGQYGLMQMILLFGALVGTITVSKLSGKDGESKTLKIGTFLMMGALIALVVIMFPGIINVIGNGKLSYFVLLVCSLFILYLSIMFINIPVQTMIQKQTPHAYMSRVFSIVGLITKGGMPLGSLLYGVLLEKISIHNAVTSAVIIVVLITIAFSILIKRTSSLKRQETVL